jgi:hypothetical protein
MHQSMPALCILLTCRKLWFELAGCGQCATVPAGSAQQACFACLAATVDPCQCVYIAKNNNTSNSNSSNAINPWYALIIS